ncbi:uncharacterized protein [Halyomorpha halys]|uniref:uncharacterized protein isoform X1 n=1 Tax=Halyomorpha halys TaxID=286706 RepID=UPI0006D4D61C|nr:uncharacterized protein LOC106687129 isoform X1 [Halyomorpha halys]XP_024216536.1 uncharacterized protein LOC106687129 isoform X1 [Halyomorpha halys]XP_024216537.1 uncharacterized protein LOC106687129 isoform X1 [Halyomorpha halys]XP_024216538.1 uncharacterized protein LOC106687129 isoform X1 [Halyomorpha halys]XP_024216539.1 uncharacterized protein LOC106687129 isoform X1 [Halyomorpha halys]XP_024216540.1 uncharacterized protein LOC106687129 isoform X1 [Halyomorpha halys]XP_024216541.1 un
MSVEKKKIHVLVIKRGENQFELEALSNDKLEWYRVPTELKNLALHEQLFEKIRSRITPIIKMGGYRTMELQINRELQRTYCYEQGKFHINLSIHRELHGRNVASNDSMDEAKPPNDISLTTIQGFEDIKISKDDKVSPREIEKKFSLPKFDGKQDAANWIDEFEKECERFNIIDDKRKVEVLKNLLDDDIQEWYRANLIELKPPCWKCWKRSFLLVHGKKSWSAIREAFGYKYDFGSLIEFAREKERLLLEADKDIPEAFRIYQIVCELPIDIQDGLERNKIKSINDLIQELEKFEVSCVILKEFGGKRKLVRQLEFEEKPCTVCETLGYTYHPVLGCGNEFQTPQHSVSEQDKTN